MAAKGVNTSINKQYKSLVECDIYKCNGRFKKYVDNCIGLYLLQKVQFDKLQAENTIKCLNELFYSFDFSCVPEWLFKLFKQYSSFSGSVYSLGRQVVIAHLYMLGFSQYELNTVVESGFLEQIIFYRDAEKYESEILKAFYRCIAHSRNEKGNDIIITDMFSVFLLCADVYLLFRKLYVDAKHYKRYFKSSTGTLAYNDWLKVLSGSISENLKSRDKISLLVKDKLNFESAVETKFEKFVSDAFYTELFTLFGLSDEEVSCCKGKDTAGFRFFDSSAFAARTPVSVNLYSLRSIMSKFNIVKHHLKNIRQMTGTRIVMAFSSEHVAFVGYDKEKQGPAHLCLLKRCRSHSNGPEWFVIESVINETDMKDDSLRCFVRAAKAAINGPSFNLI